MFNCHKNTYLSYNKLSVLQLLSIHKAWQSGTSHQQHVCGPGKNSKKCVKYLPEIHHRGLVTGPSFLTISSTLQQQYTVSKITLNRHSSIHPADLIRILFRVADYSPNSSAWKETNLVLVQVIQNLEEKKYIRNLVHLVQQTESIN